MLEYKPNIVLSEKEYNIVGKRPIRPDGAEKVTGYATYGADIRLPGMLYGKILRSPYAHARIKSIDTRHAMELPGVHAVMTSEDLAQPSGRIVDLAEGVMHNMRFLSNNIMAADKVLYKGHAIAAVAATSPHIAEEALALIQVEYEELPPVLTAEEAMKPGAPLLHERLASISNVNMRPGGTLSDDDPTPGSNLANRFEFRLGDLDQGFQEADVIVEHETFTSPIHQGYIEPHTATAMWHNDGTLTIWSSSQGHFNVRDQTARLINMPVSKVRAIPMEIGGGFGGKTLVYVEPIAAMLARKAGHPVKVTMTRTEVFEASGPTSGTHVRVKLGATKDGRLVAGEAHLIYEAGAFPGSPVAPACHGIMGPYEIPNAWIEGFDVVVNKPKSAAYRAPGVPAGAYAMETAIDILCEKLGMDPLEFRLKNSAKEGTRAPTGPVWPRIGFVEVLQAAKDHPHYATPLTGPYRGRGVASGLWRNNTGPSSVVAVVHSDGTVHLTEGSPDIGGTRASISQQFAETLGIPFEDVHPEVGHTDAVGFTSVTGGSGVTFKTGWAAYHAAQDIKRQMCERAAKTWDVPVEKVTYEDGVLLDGTNPERRLTFKQVAARQVATGGPIVGRSGVNPPGAGASMGTHIVDVEVDPETGKVTILRYTAVQDAGKAIHPSYVEGQIQGGAAQGIGWALNEEYFFNEKGHMVNSSFLDYRMPTCLDLPMIDTVIVEVPNPNHPFGVRGVGETSVIPPLAAMTNAVSHAIGVRLNRLPLSPGRILEALWQKNGTTNGTNGR
jgi:CO/xanthine dehydrogenase Mo-binding subunit